MSAIIDNYNEFLDTKFIPLDPKKRLLIGGAVLLIVGVGIWYALLYPQKETIARLTVQEDKLRAELDKVNQRARTRGKIEQELETVKEEFEEKSVMLPKEKEIPQLLKDISSLGTNAGLEFQTFRPQGDVPKDFYAEIPISINVSGPYHNVGYFLDQVSKLGRIVTVDNIQLGNGKADSGEMILKSTCTLKTYRFTNQQLTQNTKKRRRR